MIRYRTKGRTFKAAEQAVPATDEFAPLRDAAGDEIRADLLGAGELALARVVAALPDPHAVGVRPDDVYAEALGAHGLRARWEGAFGGEEESRRMFGLMAWVYFFDHPATWLASAPGGSRPGKQGWTFKAEAPRTPVAAPRRARSAFSDSEGPVAAASASASDSESAEYVPRIGDCVFWDFGGAYGRICAGPDGGERYTLFLNPHWGAPEEHSVLAWEVARADGKCSAGCP